MFENKNSRCRTCRFWWPTAEAGAAAERERAVFGQCRYDAPRAVIGDLPDHKPHYSTWPSTKRDEWCGRHMHLTS